MLKTRIITALVLIAILVVILSANSFYAVALTAAIFFAAAAWECFRLFRSQHPIVGAAMWSAVFVFLALRAAKPEVALLCGVCVAIWTLRFTPSLALGLPQFESVGNRLFNGIYGIAILGCFLAILTLYKHSGIYLFSVMAIVWIADIGAYFSGKAFGKHKLAPSISPGKSWEGAVGGWCAVLILAAASLALPAGLSDTFPVRLYSRFGALGFIAALTIMVAASIIGDLVESQLKRRAGMKDSSSLLPGHGGVLDRIDALIPTLPLAILLDSWL